MSKTEWSLIFILHNLTLKKEIDFDHIAIVPRGDQRVQQISNNNAVVNHIIDCIIDLNDKPAHPSYLIIEKDWIDENKIRPASVAFRNIISLSCIYEGWKYQIATGDSNVFAPLYSDFFDFYPIYKFNKQNFTILSPALINHRTTNNFKGQRSPRLPKTSNFQFNFDRHLTNSLLKLWRRKFKEDENDRKFKSLFRSLEMAYNACRLPDNNLSTIHDYGMILGLWVSAFEILFHPGGAKRIGYKDIVENFESHNFEHKKLNKFSYDLNKEKRKTNLAGKLYKEIYDMRNNFFHGNDVDYKSLYPFNNKDLPKLTHLAPVLFTFAVMLFLHNNFDLIDKKLQKYDSSFEMLLRTIGIEQVLRKFIA